MKTVFLAWENYHARTELLGKALGARVFYSSHLGRGGGPRLLLKYLWQGADTIAFLLRERPRAILVQTPPVFPALIAAVYALVFRGTRLMIDAHSGSFLSPKWRWALPLHRWCSRRADVTIVHMRSLLAVVAGWGARATVLSYVFDEQPPASVAYPLPAGLNVAVPSSFNPDEPLDLLFAAAALVPHAHFHVTGDARRIPADVLAGRPPNVTFTGYLTVPEYFGLLRAADAVLALTTQDHTFQTGGAEAVWTGRPLIVSDWPELRQVFSRGTVFVDHTPAGLAAGVRAVAEHGAALADEMQQLKREFDGELRAEVRRLRARLYGVANWVPAPVGDWVAEEER